MSVTTTERGSNADSNRRPYQRGASKCARRLQQSRTRQHRSSVGRAASIRRCCVSALVATLRRSREKHSTGTRVIESASGTLDCEADNPHRLSPERRKTRRDIIIGADEPFIERTSLNVRRAEIESARVRHLWSSCDPNVAHVQLRAVPADAATIPHDNSIALFHFACDVRK